MPGPYFMLIYALAFARVVILLTMDKVTEGPRDRALTWLAQHNHPLLAYFVECPWCVSIWIALPAAPVIYAYGKSPWLVIPALVFALSMVAGLGARAKG